MRSTFTLYVLIATHFCIAQSENKLTVGTERMLPAKNAIQQSTFIHSEFNAHRSAPIWEDSFEYSENWIADGPIGADGENYGWSIGDTTNSWYSPIEPDMGTSGSFARFRNGTNTTFLQSGPFTLTYANTIDLTDVENPFLEFYQYGARFRTLQAVQISLDGVEWITVGTNNELPVTNSFATHIYPKPHLKRIRLSSFLDGDISSVHLRFFWDGQLNGQNVNYLDYGWYIDDVSIRPGYEHDLTLNYVTTHFMGDHGYSYSVVPFQANSANIHFKASITNNGNNIENAYVQVFNNAPFNQNSSDTMLYPGQTAIIDLGPNLSYPIIMNPPQINFKVKSNNELLFEDDDESTFAYTKANVHNAHMAVDRYDWQANSMTGGFIGWSNASGTQGIGAIYEKLGNFGEVVGFVEIGIANVSASQQANYIGNSVYAEIWSYSEEGFIFHGATSSHVIQAENFGSTIFLGVDNIEPCVYTPGSRLVVLACFDANAIVPIAYAGTALFESVLGRNNDNFYLLAPTHEGSVFSSAPVVRPHFYCPLSVHENTNELLNFQIYPNPTEGNATILFQLNMEEDVIIVIRDLAGKTIQTINAGKLTAGAHNISMNLEGVAQGMYTVTISAGTSAITQKMIVK